MDLFTFEPAALIVSYDSQEQSVVIFWTRELHPIPATFTFTDLDNTPGTGHCLKRSSRHTVSRQQPWTTMTLPSLVDMEPTVSPSNSATLRVEDHQPDV